MCHPLRSNFYLHLAPCRRSALAETLKPLAPQSPIPLRRTPGNASKRQLFFNQHVKLPQLQPHPARRAATLPPLCASVPSCLCALSVLFPVPCSLNPLCLCAFLTNPLCVFVAANQVIAAFCGGSFFSAMHRADSKPETMKLNSTRHGSPGCRPSRGRARWRDPEAIRHPPEAAAGPCRSLPFA